MRVLAALSSDVDSGRVWIKSKQVNNRALFRIKNLESSKKCYCDILTVDGNYLNQYKESRTVSPEQFDEFVIINSWYRALLGIESTNIDVELEVIEVSGFYSKFRASTQHPQVPIRLSMWLAALSVSLGILSVVISIL